MVWSCYLEPQSDELLSSFLVRCAQAHGLNAYRFCAQYFPGIPVWNRDIDRSASDAFMAMLSDHAQLAITRCWQMSLRSIETAMRISTTTMLKPGIAPWIQAVGVFHRRRLRHGLVYCPLCLKNTPSFNRQWRLSFVTVCEKHCIVLRDACPHCDGPLELHRQEYALAVCARCGHNLHGPIETQASGINKSRLIDFQQTCLKTLTNSATGLSNEAVSVAEYFGGLRLMMSAIMKRDSKQESFSHNRLPFELARVEKRIRWIEALSQRAEANPALHLDAVRELRRRQSVALKGPALRLRVVSKKATKPVKHPLRQRLDLQRHAMPLTWRSARAELLIKTIKDRHGHR